MKNSVSMDDLEDVKEISTQIMDFYESLFDENAHHLVLSAICSCFVHSTIEKSIDLQKACKIVEAAVRLFEMLTDKLYDMYGDEDE